MYELLVGECQTVRNNGVSVERGSTVLLLLLFGSRTKTYRDFVASAAASRPEKLVPLAFKTAFLLWNSCQSKSKSSNICWRSNLKNSKDKDKNSISTRWSIAKVSQTQYHDFIALVSQNM